MCASHTGKKNNSVGAHCSPRLRTYAERNVSGSEGRSAPKRTVRSISETKYWRAPLRQVRQEHEERATGQLRVVARCANKRTSRYIARSGVPSVENV